MKYYAKLFSLALVAVCAAGWGLLLLGPGISTLSDLPVHVSDREIFEATLLRCRHIAVASSAVSVVCALSAVTFFRLHRARPRPGDR